MFMSFHFQMDEVSSFCNKNYFLEYIIRWVNGEEETGLPFDIAIEEIVLAAPQSELKLDFEEQRKNAAVIVLNHMIEVKVTEGPNFKFSLSRNELLCSKMHTSSYSLLAVCNFKNSNSSENGNHQYESAPKWTSVDNLFNKVMNEDHVSVEFVFFFFISFAVDSFAVFLRIIIILHHKNLLIYPLMQKKTDFVQNILVF